MTQQFTENTIDYDEIIHYKAENEIVLKVRNTNETALVTYVLSIEVSKDRNIIIINREDFKVNNEEVSNKFPYISLQYMNAIFPVKLTLIENKLEVSNTDEIIESITNEDEKLKKEYSGKGFSHIRDQFLDNTKSKNELNNFILNLNFIKVIQLTLIENSLKSNSNLNWVIVPYQSVASILFENESEKTIKNGEVQNQKELIKSINKFSELNNLNVDLNFQPDYFRGEFNQEMNGFERNFKFDSVETNFLVEVDNNFTFQEKITLNIIY